MSDIRSALQQFEQQPMPSTGRRRMSDAASIAVAGVEQLRASLDDGERLVVAAVLYGGEKGVVVLADGDVLAGF